MASSQENFTDPRDRVYGILGLVWAAPATMSVVESIYNKLLSKPWRRYIEAAWMKADHDRTLAQVFTRPMSYLAC